MKNYETSIDGLELDRVTLYNPNTKTTESTKILHYNYIINYVHLTIAAFQIYFVNPSHIKHPQFSPRKFFTEEEKEIECYKGMGWQEGLGMEEGE